MFGFFHFKNVGRIKKSFQNIKKKKQIEISPIMIHISTWYESLKCAEVK